MPEARGWETGIGGGGKLNTEEVLPDLAKLTTHVVSIQSLLPANSPRLSGEDSAHTRLLAEVEEVLPPILVQQNTMRVIDGMHRLRAALLRGEDVIEVRFVEVSDEAAFLLAVQANLAHGLPLSLADRKAAASRILSMRPEWSDRAVAAAAGLSSKTVGAIRRRSGGESPHPNTRVGRDGRTYPLNGANGRQRASALIATRPDASVREIAATAGVSFGTARDVRERRRQGKAPLTPSQRGLSNSTSFAKQVSPGHKNGGSQHIDWSSIHRALLRDPALKYSESGRSLVKRLDACAINSAERVGLVDAVPARWYRPLADIAHSWAQEWKRFAEELERRGRAAEL